MKKLLLITFLTAAGFANADAGLDIQHQPQMYGEFEAQLRPSMQWDQPFNVAQLHKNVPWKESVNDSVPFQGPDMIFVRLAKMLTATETDPSLVTTLTEYVGSCVMPNLATGSLKLNEILQSTDLYRAMQVTDHKRGMIGYRTEPITHIDVPTEALPCDVAWEVTKVRRKEYQLALAVKAFDLGIRKDVAIRSDKSQSPNRESSEHFSHKQMKHEKHCCPTDRKAEVVGAAEAVTGGAVAAVAAGQAEAGGLAKAILDQSFEQRTVKAK